MFAAGDSLPSSFRPLKPILLLSILYLATQKQIADLVSTLAVECFRNQKLIIFDRMYRIFWIIKLGLS